MTTIIKRIAMTSNKRLYFILSTAEVLLFIPFVAMQFTNEVNWSVGDFIVAAGLLFGVGLSFEFVLRKIKSTNHRIAISLCVLILFCLLWLELAVGIFDSPIAGS